MTEKDKKRVNETLDDRFKWCDFFVLCSSFINIKNCNFNSKRRSIDIRKTGKSIDEIYDIQNTILHEEMLNARISIPKPSLKMTRITVELI